MQVVSNINLFAKCQLDYTNALGAAFTNIMPRIPVISTFEVPAMELNFPSTSEDIRAEIRGMGMSQITETKFQGSPSASNLGKILKHGPLDSRVTPGFVSVNGYIAYIQSIRAMLLYQYFTEAVSKNDVAIRTPSFTSIDTCAGSTAQVGIWSDRSVIEEYPMQSLVKDNGRHLVYVNETRPFAYPHDKSRSITTQFLRPVDGVVHQGLFFAYFRGMNTPDRTFAATIFQRLFFKCLGPDPMSAARNFGRIREGFRQLSHFPAGLAITHAFLGISISENAQVPIKFVIDNGTYHGFVLTGAFSVIYRNVLYTPESAVEVTRQIQQLNVHGLTLAALVTKLNRALKADGNPFVALDVTSIDSSRKLVNAIRQRRHTGSISEADWEGIFDDTKSLRFNDNFKQASPVDILNFLKYVRGDDAAISDYPAYLGGGYAKMTTRVEVGLGIFGPTAPSVSFDSKGRTFTLPSSGSPDTNLDVTNGKRNLQFIPIEYIPVLNAIERWNSIIKNGKMVLPNPKKGSKSFVDKKDYILAIGGTDFAPVYELIKSLAESARTNAAGGKKRKAEDSGETSSAAKKRRELIEDADML